MSTYLAVPGDLEEVVAFWPFHLWWIFGFSSIRLVLANSMMQLQRTLTKTILRLTRTDTSRGGNSKSSTTSMLLFLLLKVVVVVVVVGGGGQRQSIASFDKVSQLGGTNGGFSASWAACPCRAKGG
jgi:hypothetical protein